MHTPKRTVVISGTSRGIGKATAIHFLRKGWQVIGCSRGDRPELTSYETAEFSDADLHHVNVDLSKVDALNDFVVEILTLLKKQPLHALVNNAAISPKTQYKERLGCLNGHVEDWKEVFNLNFFAPLLLARHLAPKLAEAEGEAAIINLTSIAGHTVHPFAGSAYSTSKAALSALTREMAVEFAEIGVRVNAIAPGEIKTSMLSPEYEPLSTRIPLQRLGSVEEIAAVIYQLCGNDFSYVTGSEIYLTGGQHL